MAGYVLNIAMAVLLLAALSVPAGAADGEEPAARYSIDCPVSLHFGMVVTCPAGGTLSVPPQGAPRRTGCIINSPGTTHAGQCRVEQSGGAYQQLQIAVLGPTVLNGEGGQMPVDELVLHSAQGQSSEAGDFLVTSEGRTDIRVGGRLNVAPAQGNGTYSGAVTVTVLTE